MTIIVMTAVTLALFLHIRQMILIGKDFYLGPDMQNIYSNVYATGMNDERRRLRRMIDHIQVAREDVYKMMILVLLCLIYVRLGR